jgi:two-component system response regulator DegU
MTGVAAEHGERKHARRTKILLVDDHLLFRNLLRRVLEGHPDLEIVGEAADGEEARRICLEKEPDVVLLDLEMPGKDGIQTLTEVKRANPAIRFIALTSHLENPYVFEALKAGASGYLSKDTTRQKLIEAINVVLKGEALIDPQVTVKLLKEFIRLSKSTAPGVAAEGLPDDGTLALLSEREREIVAQVGTGKTNQEISRELFISINTVKKHVANILKKLKLSDRVQIALYASRWGLVE